jgi:F-type H+-transporting ATPase subunit b
MMLRNLTDASAAGAMFSRGAGGGVEVDFDLSFVVQIVFIVVLVLVLKPVLFDPMLKLFEERERRIDGAKLAARKTDEKSAGALAKYESAMAEARAAANAERETLRAEGIRAENELLAKVRATTAKTLDEGKKKAQAEAEAARKALSADAVALAKDLASRVLGREVSG